MKEFREQINLGEMDQTALRYFAEDTLSFDIETTGLYAKNCCIYLIGCAYRKGDQMVIRQFFGETPQEEAHVLAAFLELASHFSTLLSFNGIGFDQPFIESRCSRLGIPQDLGRMRHVDIYRLTSPLKKVLKLANLKQKTIEEFLSVEREDTYGGDELINVYSQYQQNPDVALLGLMLQHNRDDVAGMMQILPILSYHDFFGGGYALSDSGTASYQEYEGGHSMEQVFTLAPNTPLPKRISCGRDDIYMTGFGDMVRLRVKIYQGELKYFYSNYQDYYYLPEEDMAVHKSVAFYVDKNYRTQAKAATCYSKKTGKFLPQYGDWFTPYFKLEYHDRISYVEMTEEFTQDDDAQREYVRHLLETLL